MRTFESLKREHPNVVMSNDVFAAYYNDGGGEEWLYFKMIPWHVIRYIARVLHQMRLFMHFRLEKDEEEFRNGYINEKYCLRMIERNEAFVPVRDLKLITGEVAEAMGYRLHWVSVDSLLNMRDII